MRVFIKTPARLHLGLIDLGGKLGRIFGSIGVAIDYPNVTLEATSSETLRTSGEKSAKVRALITEFFKFYKLKRKVHINILEMIPEHVGLGSGTQLSLAIATSLSKLFGIRASVRELASVMRRGSISGVGTAVFEYGGFNVDGGHKIKSGCNRFAAPKDSPPPLIFRHPFPEDWFFVVAIPKVERGFTDEEEIPAFRSLPPMALPDVGRICHHTLMGLLPAIIEKDIENFGSHLSQIQNIVGNYFKGAQGGEYSSSLTKECAKYMSEMGAYGVGQSSWGPSIYGLVHKIEQARKLKLVVEEFLGERKGGKVFHTSANNKGAYIRVL